MLTIKTQIRNIAVSCGFLLYRKGVNTTAITGAFADERTPMDLRPHLLLYMCVTVALVCRKVSALLSVLLQDKNTLTLDVEWDIKV